MEQLFTKSHMHFFILRSYVKASLLTMNCHITGDQMECCFICCV